MSLCLSISGCEFGDDDEEFDWGSASVCGLFESAFGDFEERTTYTDARDGAVFYGTCDTFSCNETDLTISVECNGNGTGSVSESCNNTAYNFTGSASAAVDIEIDASGVIVDATEKKLKGSVSATINTLDLTLIDSGSSEVSISCTGTISYDDFDSGKFKCENSTISCTSATESVNCAAIKTVIDAARANAEGRALCAASSSQGAKNDLIELAIMKIEEVLEKREAAE